MNMVYTWQLTEMNLAIPSPRPSWLIDPECTIKKEEKRKEEEEGRNVSPVFKKKHTKCVIFLTAVLRTSKEKEIP